MYDLCVIGGGAAGLCAAISAARLGKSVIIIEKNNKPGKKIYATGNGKCNITNECWNYNNIFMSNNSNISDFLKPVLSNTPNDKVREFLESIGILTYSNNGYVYPVSNQASSIVWALLEELNKLNVKIENKVQIEKIDIYDTFFVLKSNNGEYKASTVIVSCGGKSYESLGGSESGYLLAKQLGHTVTKLNPALCGIETNENLSEISGVRISATAKLYGGKSKEAIAIESGELQIAEYGISGIMIFNLSSIAGKILSDKKNPYIIIDLVPNLEIEAIKSLYYSQSHRTLMGFLNGFINDKIALYFIKKSNIEPKEKLYNISLDIIEKIFNDIKQFKVEIKKLRDFDNAQVTSGGVDLNEIQPETMMSKKISGLFFAGEILDVDGICGGYNLTFAMLSGLLAGKSSASYIEKYKSY